MLIKIKDKKKYMLGLKNNEFEFFLSKFYGTLISRGRKSFAIKLFNKILLNLKKKFSQDPFIILHKSINNLVPLLTSTQKKIGKVYHSVPKLAVGNRRYVIMLN
jgi:ribosomal protein S7